jgi:transposase
MDNELKTNARQATSEEQYQIRKSIIRLLKNGISGRETARLLDVSEGHVSNVKRAYEKEGAKGLKLGRRGRRKGMERKLSPDQEKEIQDIIVDKYPEQMKIPGCMWTRESIRNLIQIRYKVTLPLSTLGYYLSRWGFSVQRPTKRAFQQDSEKVQKWVESEFPGIKERAKSENAEIFFGDEVGIQNTANYAKGYAPIGKTPILRVESKKIRINMLSAVSSKGKLRFVIYKDNMNSDKLIDFMRRLVYDTKRKVFLVLDNLRVHRSKKVATWLEKHKGEIEVFFLPPYSPEYNPDEFLNSDLKRNLGKRSASRSEAELEHNVRSHMKSIQLRPEKIRSFFRTRTTSYAA